MVDAGTVRRIVRIAKVQPDDAVVEVGPGLGSLTLALLEAGAQVTAVEIDPCWLRRFQRRLPRARRTTPLDSRSLPPTRSSVTSLDPPPTLLVANLPYNVSVPVILHFLETFPSLERVLVMVQKEVADRLAAPPGSRTYGIPSAKAAWYCDVRLAGNVGRAVFWPVPRVDSSLVLMERREPPVTDVPARAGVRGDGRGVRPAAQGACAGRSPATPGLAAAAEAALRAAGIDPLTRGEQLRHRGLCRDRRRILPRSNFCHAEAMTARRTPSDPRA